MNKMCTSLSQLHHHPQTPEIFYHTQIPKTNFNHAIHPITHLCHYSLESGRSSRERIHEDTDVQEKQAQRRRNEIA